MTAKQIHLANRAAFGTSLSEFAKRTSQTSSQFLLQSSKQRPLQVIEKPEIEPSDMRSASGEKRKKLFQKSRKETIQVNVTWMKQMTSPEAMVREKMTLFWHDHFACRTQVAYLAQQQNNTIRKNSLGSFRDLLRVVSKDPAMLQFLNNQQNKKDSPNENFAREVMELFTLGRGNYTEADVKNAARSFTGWGFSPLTGEFLFRPKVHDEGSKEFRGKRGNFTGDDIIDMILEDKQTARFITEKIWTYFISTDTKDENLLSSLAADFYKSDYNIERLVNSIYSSDWFYADRFLGNRIKSPIELVVGIQLQTGGLFQDEFSSVFVQRALGQILFYPPNVGGWPQGKEWIDSSSLTFRMSLPSILFNKGETDFQGKDDGDVNNLSNDVRKSKISFAVDWGSIANQFAKERSTKTLEQIESFLLARPTTKENRVLIDKYTVSSGNDVEFVQRAYIGFMSLPEYQLS